MKILESASKVVFVMVALTSCAAFLLGRLESKDYMVLAGLAFTFYFSQKGEQGEPFAGK